MNTNQMGIKQKIVHETKLFFIYALSLAFFFCSLTLYKRLILEENSISYFHYGYGIVQALIIAKIIILGQNLRLADRLSHKPLIISILYKTVFFSFLVLLFSVLERYVEGLLKGFKSGKIYQEFMSNGIYQVSAKSLVIFFVFILFFAFLEMARVLGEGKLFDLFFRRSIKDDSNDS